MQRFAAKRSVQNISVSLWRRCISSTSQAATASVKDSDEFQARLPPFAYTPPPYTGPSADVILSKRKEFLSPSMFCLYRKPVRDPFQNSRFKCLVLKLFLIRIVSDPVLMISVCNNDEKD
jgi:hypothetical protein